MNDKKLIGCRGFTEPAKSNSSFGRWVVFFYRNGFTYLKHEQAFFWKKKDALEFVKANQ